jgi:hypothetical protein
MFELIIGSNLNRNSTVTSFESTPAEALDEAGIDYSVGVLHLDGVTLEPGDIHKTFRDLGVGNKASLICVVKADAA